MSSTNEPAKNAVTLYYVDGYHGGTRGHMPVGAWRDVLGKLMALPNWRLSFDVEPDSWRRVRAEDPEAYAELCQYFKEPVSDSRVEVVNGSFTQPFGWAMTGESNIRQLLRGIAAVRHHFPEIVIDTFATQEPCWASFFPQILVSLGYKRAILKNSTMWGGYTVGVDAELLNWVGPDGSSLPAVPRYECETVADTWQTISYTGAIEYAERCIEHGIPHPTGVFIQDLGWGAKPWVSADHIQHVTWREYITKIAEPVSQDWHFSPEDIRCTLPWGEKTIQRIAAQVRTAENRLIVAEKLAVLAAVWSKTPYPTEKLAFAWDQLFWAQHHDAWITATTRRGRDAWAWQVAAETWDAEQVCDDVEEASRLTGDPLNLPLVTTTTPSREVRVFNTLGHARTDLVEIGLPTDLGTLSIVVRDNAGDIIPCQLAPSRKYLSTTTDVTDSKNHRSELAPGESIAAGKLTFAATVSAMGYGTYTLESSSQPPALGTLATTQADGNVVVETDLYRIQIDPSTGGTISSLYAKVQKREYCGSSERKFNEYRGYFVEENAWRSSTEHPATVRIIESGPVRASVAIEGQISSVKFQTIISLANGQRRIDFSTQLLYDKETWIGDPWDLKPEERNHNRKSHHDDRFKLLASFPVPFIDQEIYKNAAFDVCKSKNDDTFFQGWDEIKHNIIVNWVDVVSERENYGLALYSNHTTSYAHGENHPLSLVLGWGWQAGFWWGKCPLIGQQEVKYSLVPHEGKWDSARLWDETTRIAEPLSAALIPIGLAPKQPTSRSLVDILAPGVELSSVTVDGQDLVLRVFNAESDAETCRIAFEKEPQTVKVVELDGRDRETLSSRKSTDGRFYVDVALPRFAIRTLVASGLIE